MEVVHYFTAEHRSGFFLLIRERAQRRLTPIVPSRFPFFNAAYLFIVLPVYLLFLPFCRSLFGTLATVGSEDTPGDVCDVAKGH